jgi:HSP20 family molecular chaperone IbpA
VDLNQEEIIIQGEFPDLCTSEDVEFLERHRAWGFFEKKFLLPPNLTLQKHEWQLVDGVLQIRMILEARKEPNLLLE